MEENTQDVGLGRVLRFYIKNMIHKKKKKKDKLDLLKG